MTATGLTAQQAIDSVLRVRRGETVIVHGAAGGVGSLAVQFALARGARDEVYRLIYGPPAKRDAFMNTLQRSDSTKIARGIQLIAAADLAIKTSLAGGGPKGARLQLEVLVCELAS